MKHSAIAALTAVLFAAPISAGAVSYSQYSNYRGGGVMLRMSVPMGTVLSPGEEIAFKYQTPRDAYVIVYNIDSEGYVHILHPEDPISMSAAGNTYDVPEGRNSSLVVSGETGIEFVFALSVPDRSFIDEDELDYLLSLDTDENAVPYRVDGDPFLAANIVAAELVRGISRRPDIFLGFTYFYINERVDHPCYLCGECDRRDASSDCERFQIVADFDRTEPMPYPLSRAYEMVDQGVAIEYDSPESETDLTTNVTFYPYSSEVYTYSRPYVFRVYDSYWYDPWYWDPWYAGWHYYPYAYPSYGWGVSISFGWGWGGGYWGWGGYYSSSYYYPSHHYYGYGGYGYGGTYTSPERFKTKYKTNASSTLLTARRQAIRRDGDLRIASTSMTKTRGTVTAKSRSTRTSTRVARTDRSRSFRQSSVTKTRARGARVSGTSRERARTTYKRRTASNRDNRSTAAVRRGARSTSSREKSSVRSNRSTTTRRTYSTSRRSSTTRTRGYERSTRTRSSSGKSSVRSTGRTTTPSKSRVRSTTRGSSNRSSVRSGSRSGTQVRGTTRGSSNRSSVRSGSRSGGSRSRATRSGGTRSRSGGGGKRR